MKKVSSKKTGIPPLLCWDIYSEWLNKNFGIGSVKFPKTKKEKAKEL
jgi:hypothetical protein